MLAAQIKGHPVEVAEQIKARLRVMNLSAGDVVDVVVPDDISEAGADYMLQSLRDHLAKTGAHVLLRSESLEVTRRGEHLQGLHVVLSRVVEYLEASDADTETREMMVGEAADLARLALATVKRECGRTCGPMLDDCPEDQQEVALVAASSLRDVLARAGVDPSLARLAYVEDVEEPWQAGLYLNGNWAVPAIWCLASGPEEAVRGLIEQLQAMSLRARVDRMTPELLVVANLVDGVAAGRRA